MSLSSFYLVPSPCLMLLFARSNSSTQAPGALEQIYRSVSHIQHTSDSQTPPAMPDTSPLGGPAWEIALNNQGLDIKPSD